MTSRGPILVPSELETLSAGLASYKQWVSVKWRQIVMMTCQASVVQHV